jgi:ferritin-like protein
MVKTALHEAREDLTAGTVEMHRALASLIEELEAVDWYGQRVDACRDDALAAVLAHNRDEEKEHACMTLEWIRRRDAKFDEHLRQFLFREGSIVATERGDESLTTASDDTLGIGSLRREEPE